MAQCFVLAPIDKFSELHRNRQCTEPELPKDNKRFLPSPSPCLNRKKVKTSSQNASFLVIVHASSSRNRCLHNSWKVFVKFGFANIVCYRVFGFVHFLGT